MSLREKLNKNPLVVAGSVVVVIALAVWITVKTTSAQGQEVPTVAHYTDDGGKTFFVDDVNKIVPYDRNGKKVYRAEVFKGNGEPFVALLLRHNAGAQKELADYFARKIKDPDGSYRKSIEYRGLQMKKVGDPDNAWLYSEDGSGDRLRSQIVGKNGEPVTPVIP